MISSGRPPFAWGPFRGWKAHWRRPSGSPRKCPCDGEPTPWPQALGVLLVESDPWYQKYFDFARTLVGEMSSGNLEVLFNERDTLA